MTHLGLFFERECETRKITARDLAESLGIDPVVISRAKHGQPRSFELPTVIKMFKGIPRQSRDAFLAAYLLDIRDACKSKGVQIEVAEAADTIAEDPAAYRDRFDKAADLLRKQNLTSQELEALLSIAGRLKEEPDLHRLVLSLASYVGK